MAERTNAPFAIIPTRNRIGLLSLPRELRFMIFFYLLVAPTNVDIGSLTMMSNSRLSLGILLVSRMLRREALEVFWRENIFSLDPRTYQRIPLPLAVDKISNICLHVVLYWQLPSNTNFLLFMPHLGTTSIIRGLLHVVFTLNGDDPQSLIHLRWYARALGRFTKFRTIQLQFLYRFGGLNRTPVFNAPEYFKLALEPVLGPAVGFKLQVERDGLLFKPVDHVNRLVELQEVDWADFLDGLRFEWNKDPTNADDVEE